MVQFLKTAVAGPGADTKGRPAWIKKLTDKEAKEYTVENIFRTVNSSPDGDASWFQSITPRPFDWPQQKAK